VVQSTQLKRFQSLNIATHHHFVSKLRMRCYRSQDEISTVTSYERSDLVALLISKYQRLGLLTLLFYIRGRLIFSSSAITRYADLETFLLYIRDIQTCYLFFCMYEIRRLVSPSALHIREMQSCQLFCSPYTIAQDLFTLLLYIRVTQTVSSSALHKRYLFLLALHSSYFMLVWRYFETATQVGGRY